MIDKFSTILFILSILPKFYLEQIFLVVRLKICPLWKNLSGGGKASAFVMRWR